MLPPHDPAEHPLHEARFGGPCDLIYSADSQGL
jgi:hypothetical protein